MGLAVGGRTAKCRPKLQHIWRFLVERAPKLVDCEDYEPWTPAITTALAKHDNAFEHLVIVPRELRVFPENKERWEAVMARNWNDIATGHGQDVARK